MTNNDGQVEILLVEDSALDARVIQEGFKKIEVPNRIHVVGNGERALAFLHRGVEFAEAPRPDLIRFWEQLKLHQAEAHGATPDDSH